MNPLSASIENHQKKNKVGVVLGTKFGPITNVSSRIFISVYLVWVPKPWRPKIKKFLLSTNCPIFDIKTKCGSFFLSLNIKDSKSQVSIAGLSMNGLRLHSHVPTQASIYLGVLSSHIQNFIWQINRTSTLQQVCSVIILQMIHLQLYAKFPFVETHYII